MNCIQHSCRHLRWSCMVQAVANYSRCQNVFAPAVNGRYGAKTHQKGPHWYDQLIFPWKSKEELVKDLISSRIYEDECILVLNKPYGLPMHALKYKELLPLDARPPQTAEFSVFSSLRMIKAEIGSGELSFCFSQSRLHSGIIVLSKDRDVYKELRKYFRHARTNKNFCDTYWAITHGVPKTEKNAEKFPMEQIVVEDPTTKLELFQSIHLPNVSKKARQLGKAIAPDIKHQTLATNDNLNVALVEVTPTVIKWDAIQLYLLHQHAAVLGDHHYSQRFVQIAGKPAFMKPRSALPRPQKLPEEILRQLDLSKHHRVQIPLHIHCRQLTLPNLSRGKQANEMLTVTAPLPPLFSQSLDYLNLTIPPLESYTGELFIEKPITRGSPS